ncbi:MAG: sigma-70 family RNA polymerase sigma factor [Deltaproteobacteria bacterium]|nr:sigma-70 family RNA polymerase sigma factor [Deltaproteobacteria bacterium]
MPDREQLRSLVSLALRVCRRILANSADAEDAAQDALERFLRSGFEGRSRPTTYLFTVATRVCIDRLRRLRRQERAYDEWARQQEMVGLAEDRRSTDNMLLIGRLLSGADLSDDDAAIAIHYFVHGMTEQEIAEAMDMKRRTVGWRLARLTGKTRQMVSEDGNDRS